MKQENFETAVNKQIEFCKALLIGKAKEYSETDPDRLGTFKRSAAILHCSPKEALCGMMSKHTISIYDMCMQGEYSLEKWTEKITDHINYLLILKAMVEEEKNAKN